MCRAALQISGLEFSGTFGLKLKEFIDVCVVQEQQPLPGSAFEDKMKVAHERGRRRQELALELADLVDSITGVKLSGKFGKALNRFADDARMYRSIIGTGCDGTAK